MKRQNRIIIIKKLMKANSIHAKMKRIKSEGKSNSQVKLAKKETRESNGRDGRESVG